ncbi:MAG: Fic family protein [Bacteroidales bacterium]|nr:Fic family protein [Candidatus Sodaliphilus aphodohippi]
MSRNIYIWQDKDWPHFTWDEVEVAKSVGQIKRLQGQLSGELSALGFEVQSITQLDAMTQELLRSSEIEGQFINADSLRLSIARHLGIETDNNVITDHYVEGLVQAMADASGNYLRPVNSERLFGWHAALFPTGYSGSFRISVADWRQGDEPMQVVSGAMGKERVHFEAPPSALVPQMMSDFLAWVNSDNNVEPIVKAGVAHLWFLTVHPFDDGNGRIARTLTDLLLARADAMPSRYYSVSAQICTDKKNYYEIIERTQKRNLDITDWLLWFNKMVGSAIECSLAKIDQLVQKHDYWLRYGHVVVNARQKLIVNRLWDGFEGKLTSSKWAKIAKCSHDTALRDIKDLIEKGMLVPGSGGGRSTHYILPD